MRSVGVFCGAAAGDEGRYADLARRLGRAIAGRGCTLVYGGASVGLMGVVADAALAAGGRVVGVIPSMLVTREIAHGGLHDLRVVATMHERKLIMGSLADVFIALPGGVGTLDELFEMLTWTQLRFHEKPCALLDTGGFYGPLVEFLDRAVRAGFIQPSCRAGLLEGEDPDELLDRCAAWTPAPSPSR